MTDAAAPLSKIDSAVEHGDATPQKARGHRRASSSAVADGDAAEGTGAPHRRRSSTASDVFNINDLEKDGTTIKIAPETQQLNWKVNTSPATIDDKDYLKKFLCEPKLKKIDLHFPLGLEVTARNLKGVTIKDALDAIHKQFKKKADDELEAPYLAGFEWDKDECYTRFVVHLKKEGAPVSKKSKKKGGADEPIAE